MTGRFIPDHSINKTEPYWEFFPPSESLIIAPHHQRLTTLWRDAKRSPRALLPALVAHPISPQSDLSEGALAMSPHAIFVGPSRPNAVEDDASVAPRDRAGVGNVGGLHEVESSMLADAVDGLAAAIFFIDASRRVVQANASGHAMLAEGQPVRMSGTRLSAKDAVAELLLREELGIACSSDGAATGRIAIPLSGDEGQRYVAHVLPLSSGARRQAGRRYPAVAAVFVQKAAVCEAVPFEAIARCFKLTPAEMRVLFAVVEIGGVPEVAPTLGISETTVKTHLQRVFDKTGTKRQADLVKFVAGFMSPLAEPLPQ